MSGCQDYDINAISLADGEDQQGQGLSTIVVPYFYEVASLF